VSAITLLLLEPAGQSPLYAAKESPQASSARNGQPATMVLQSPANDYQWTTLPDPNVRDPHTVGGECCQKRATVVHRRSLGFTDDDASL